MVQDYLRGKKYIQKIRTNLNEIRVNMDDLAAEKFPGPEYNDALILFQSGFKRLSFDAADIAEELEIEELKLHATEIKADLEKKMKNRGQVVRDDSPETPEQNQDDPEIRVPAKGDKKQCQIQ